MRLRLSLLPLTLSFALLSMVTGCGTTPQATRPAPQPVITGRGTYLNGQLQVVAQLGPFRLVDALPPQRLGGNPVAMDAEPDTTRRPRAYAGSGLLSPAGSPPRQSLTVTISNTGSTTERVRVAEVRSVLGNFVPVPEIFNLEPGQTQALEPMRSSYPAPIDELEVVIRLRTADADEIQTLKLVL